MKFSEGRAVHSIEGAVARERIADALVTSACRLFDTLLPRLHETSPLIVHAIRLQRKHSSSGCERQFPEVYGSIHVV